MEIVSDIRRMDVMIVDPDKVKRGNLAALARDFGCYRIRPFDNAEEAIVSIVQKPPKAVCVDWGEDGVVAHKVLREIRCDPRDHIARTPIVVVTPKMERAILSKGIQWGATNFVRFPVVPAKFMECLVFILRDKRDVRREGGRLHYVAPPKKPKRAQARPRVRIVEFTQSPDSSGSIKSESGTAKSELPQDPDDILEL